MPIPRSFLLPSALLVLGNIAGAAGCAYDWTVGAQEREGSDAGAPDATIEATTVDATSPSDTATPTDSAIEASTDASDGGSPCNALEAALLAKRILAKKCSQGVVGECVTAITDECDCTSFLTVDGSAASVAYAAAIGQYAEAGCAMPASCSSESCISPIEGTCLPVDGGPGYGCYP